MSAPTTNICKKTLGIVGARLNSSRLPRKHLLDLAGKPCIERIFERLERVPELERIVLATTADDYNRPLVEWAHDTGREVFAYEGDVNDLTARADAIIQKYDAELIAYFCGDSPLIEPNTVAMILQTLAVSSNADVVTLQHKEGTAYIHEGIQIYRRGIWDWIALHSVSRADKEHLGSALHRYRGIKTVKIADDPIYAEIKHRISVDTLSDYLFMKEVYHRWYQNHPDDTIVSLRWLVGVLRDDSKLRDINDHVCQKGLPDCSASFLLAVEACGTDGYRRVVRMVALARALQDYFFAGVQLVFHGDPLKLGDNIVIPHRWLLKEKAFVDACRTEIEQHGVNCVVIDDAGQRDRISSTLADHPEYGVVSLDTLDTTTIPTQMSQVSGKSACGLAREVYARCSKTDENWLNQGLSVHPENRPRKIKQDYK